jgi:hypothetical protein
MVDDCWVAHDSIASDSYDEGDDKMAKVYTDLYLRVERDDEGRVVWDASISEDDAGFGDATLAEGVAATVEQAKRDCEDAAARLNDAEGT